ncbi:hypothetical protein IW261DRAFT_1518422 [Armillaria novae-zelandiae]|uniref:Uncharacterized protein n=1 Tax=Armillaria novae-zelandiae TaxID=153914 RepID=A0AA39U7G1_9AGAR|nr:hypothetical protein IW261DRAFT_1518422 [Armillaria novae-zelandiae]
MLLAVPAEIVNKITIEADGQTRGRLRRTCKLLNSIATPFVFESVYIDLAWRRRSRTLFLNSLTSGPKLAQYIIRLSLYLPKRSRHHLSRFSTKSRTKKREERLDSFDGLLLAAIPSMLALRTFSWMSTEDSGRKYTQLIFEKFGCLPLLSALNISTGFSSWDVPWSHFSHIRDISYFGCRGTELATLIGHNRNIERIDASVWRPQGLFLEGGKSISLLFSSLPQGTHSRVKKLTLDGNAYNQLYPHEIPTLLPHLRHLEGLEIYYILPPSEFWGGLREAGINLTSLTYCERTLERPLLSYLVSYTGLREMSVWVLGQSVPEDVHVVGILASIITINSWYLTRVHIDTFDNVTWCLNHPMMDSLSSCHYLESLRVCVDKSVTRADSNRNVVDRVLEAALVSWPNLWYLGIYVAVSHSYGFEAIRTTASQVHKRIMAFRFTLLPPEQATPYIYSDFAMYSAKIYDRKRNVHAFKVGYLEYYGEKELWRKCKFWKRSRDTNDD